MGTGQDRLKPQVRFVELLEELTQAGRAEWLRSNGDPGFVRCVLDGADVVVFECMGGKDGDERVSPREELAGVVAHLSNTTYLWLPEIPSWDALLRLLRRSRANADAWRGSKRIAHRAPVRALQERLKR